MSSSDEMLRGLITSHGGLVLIKLSQWLCHRKDLIPEDVVNILKPLQKHVPLNPTIQYDNEKLGILIGSGSISMVFESKTETNCIVKKYRDKEKQLKEVEIWRSVFKMANTYHSLTKFTKNIASVLLKSMIQFDLSKFNDIDTAFHIEIGRLLTDKNMDFSVLDLNGFLDILVKQLSYSNEFYYFKCLEQHLNYLDFVILPKVVRLEEDSLIMSHINGHTYDQIESKFPEYMQDFRVKMLTVYIWMVYNNVIHTDLHDGNCLYVIHPEDDNLNCVAILDYGMCSLPTKPIYWLLWKAYCNRNKSDIYSLLTEMIISSNINNVYKIDLYRKTNSNFTEWIDDILIQINSLNMTISAECSNILIGFVLLGRSEDELSLFELAIQNMTKSKNEKLRCLGEELKADHNSS